MRKYLGFYLLVGFSSLVVAQEKKQGRSWYDGKLTWQDFREKEKHGEVNSELKFIFGYFPKQEKINDTVVKRIIAICEMDKELSWVDPSFRSDTSLRYNQVIFDIAELHRRRLQYNFDRQRSVKFLEPLFRDEFSECNQEVVSFEEETKRGLDYEAIEKWAKKIGSELAHWEDHKIPPLQMKNFHYGFHVGFGSGSFTNALGNYFTPTFNFIYGFDFSSKNTVLYLNATLASGRSKKEFISDKIRFGQFRTVLALGDMSLGYTVVDNSKIKLTPFAGLGIAEISSKSSTDSLSLTDYNFLFGINAEYKIRKKVNILPEIMKEFVETSLRARLYIARVNYATALRGYCVNLTLGISVNGRLIKLKN